MAGYEFNKTGQEGRYEVKVDSKRGYGSFEHDDYGEEKGGGLWFDNGELIDFDGMGILPKEVAIALKRMGFKVDMESFCDMEKEW